MLTLEDGWECTWQNAWAGVCAQRAASSLWGSCTLRDKADGLAVASRPRGDYPTAPRLTTPSPPCAFSSCCLEGASAPGPLTSGPCPRAPGRWHGLLTPAHSHPALLAFLSSVCPTQPAGCAPSLAHMVFVPLFRTFASKGTGWDSVHFVCSCSPSGCQQWVMLAPGGQLWMSQREEGARGT